MFNKEQEMINVNAKLHTDGTGYWSDIAKSVTVTGIYVPYIAEDAEFGELCVYFNTKTWDVNEHGLIYTDRQFMKELRDMLAQMGLDATDVEYSEQGMQGEDYVSLDVGVDFINSYKLAFPAEFASAYADCN
jgi:protein associated with RNAse G/E